MLIPGVPSERQQIPLEAETTGADARLHWFVDGEFLGSVAADQRLWWAPHPGTHELVVVDETGLSARRTLEVRGNN
jgi:penicillin-binding protein 1C